MPDTHLWITGRWQADRARAAAQCQPDVMAGCHSGQRGPYTGLGTVLRALVPEAHRQQPELTARHGIEILAAAPELTGLIGAAPGTLTSLAPPDERTRWYSHYRTRRISHGVVDFLRGWPRERPLVLGFDAAVGADHSDLEFLAVALRRLDPAQVTLVVCTGPEEPEDRALAAALAASCKRRDLGDGPQPQAATGPAAAAAFIASDGTSDVPGELAGYLEASPAERARLHDERAAELAGRGEYSLTLAAIPWHLERGSGPSEVARKAYGQAADYCIGMAFYEWGLELTRRIAALTDADAEPERWDQANAAVCQCLGMLERADEAEPVYWDLLSRTTRPGRHMSISYALSMLYTRMLEPERRDHRRALAHVNTAIAIASQVADPEVRAFETVFMSNGKALVENHLGRPEEALRLVDEGIARLDRELPPDRHRLHRSVLHHNRANVLMALGRPDEALAAFSHVIEVDPNYAEYYFDRANHLARMGRHDEALADYASALQLTPPFPELYFNRGDALAAIGDTAAAMADFRAALDLEPDYLEGWVSLSALLLEAGDPQAAGEQARAGLEVLPGEPRLHCALGLALLDLADHQGARQAFDSALDLEPGMPEALANRAIAAFEAGQPEAAVADLTAALAGDEGNPDLRYNRGLAHAAAGQPREAADDFTAVLADEAADRAELLYQRGRCLADLGETERARADLEECLALGADDHEQETRELLAGIASAG
jgi:tetratricopeptide (TPR) repeat protein